MGVEELSWNTAGGQVAFRSDTGRIVLRVKMRSNDVMYHMAQTGTAGFDLYAGAAPGELRFFGVTGFSPGAREYTASLFQGSRRMRDFTIHFPLYAGVEQVFIGVNHSANVIFRLESPLPLATKEVSSSFGRFIIRQDGATLGFGTITQVIEPEAPAAKAETS